MRSAATYVSKKGLSVDSIIFGLPRGQVQGVLNDTVVDIGSANLKGLAAFSRGVKNLVRPSVERSTEAQSNGIGRKPWAVPNLFRISSPAATVLGTLIPQQSPQ